MIEVEIETRHMASAAVETWAVRPGLDALAAIEEAARDLLEQLGEVATDAALAEAVDAIGAAVEAVAAGEDVDEDDADDLVADCRAMLGEGDAGDEAAAWGRWADAAAETWADWAPVEEVAPW